MSAAARCALLVALAACQDAPPALPEGEGRGVVAADTAAPSGGETVAAPRWRAGDVFVYRRAGVARVQMRVAEPPATLPEGLVLPEGAWVLQDEDSRGVLYLDAELAEIGQQVGDRTGSLRLNVPAERRYHWPLWPGKRWTSEFVRKAPGQALAMTAAYHVDAVEEITVPAGTFRCLRIWRRLRPVGDRPWPELVTVWWYAPQVGTFVRRLENSVMLELEAAMRSSEAGAGSRPTQG